MWPRSDFDPSCQGFQIWFCSGRKDTYIIPDLDQMLKGSLAEHPAPIWQARACQIRFALWQPDGCSRCPMSSRSVPDLFSQMSSRSVTPIYFKSSQISVRWLWMTRYQISCLYKYNIHNNSIAFPSHEKLTIWDSFNWKKHQRIK